MRIILCIMMLLSFSVRAQVSHTIKGIVTDSATQKGLDYITVGLKTDRNIPVSSALTKTGGAFAFSGIKPGKYILTLVAVGYQTKRITIDLTDSIKKEKDLGSIYISPQPRQLKAVVVTADRPLITQDIDKISYDLQADPESKVSNVLEMMRKVPLLSVDADDNIQLKGSGNYKILLNGKPSGMIERNAKDVLRSMPASSIQNIEVITNPPSKYDAEGLAGIINIITNKKVDNGYNGSINVNERFPVGGPGLGGSFTFKQGKFGISGYGGLSMHSSPATSNYNSRLTTGKNPTSLIQNGSREYDGRYGYLGTELSFEIDSLNLVSGQFGFNNSLFNNELWSGSLLSGSGGVIQGYDMLNDGEGKGDGLDVSFNYQLGFKNNKNRLLTFSYRYYTYGNDQLNNLIASNRVNYTIPDYRQENDGSSSEQTIQVDYVHPIKKLTIEGGLKGIFRNNGSDFQYLSKNTATGEFELDPTRTNTFDNNQNVLGIYNSYQYNLKNWGIKAGMRLEQTDINADFISTASQIEKNYFNLIPTITVNRKLKNMASLNFGYTQRIQRPSIWNLNPFVDRSNPNIESSGNPDLKPVLANNFQLNYSKFKKGSVNIGFTYSFSDHTIQRISVFDPATNITRNTFENIGKDKSLGSNININYPLTKRWNFSLNGTLSYIWIEGTINGSMVKNDGVRGYFYGSSGYRFEKGWRISGSFNYYSGQLTLQGRTNTMINTSFSVNKDIIKDKLTFSAAARNPFSKYWKFNNEIEGTDFIQTSYFQNYYRSFTTSLNYRFGKLKSTIKKNKRGITNDDVANDKGGSEQ